MSENSEILIFLLKKNGKILHINQVVENISGFSQSEIKSKYFWDFIKNKEDIKNQFQSSNNIEILNNKLIDFITSNNKSMKARLTFTSYKDNKNETDVIICSGNPLPSNKQTIEFNSSIDSILDIISDPVFLFRLSQDKRLHLIMVNAPACEILNYTKEQLLGEQLTEIHLFKNPEKISNILLGLSEKNSVIFENKLITKEGKEITAEFGSQIIEYQQERTLLVIAQNTDNHILREKLKRIDKLEAVGLMTGGIAHDFNNVLTGIIGLTELSMRELKEDHIVNMYLKTILQKSDSASGLVRKLMFFSKDSSQKNTSTDINALLKGTVNFIHRYIGEDIIFDINPEKDIDYIFADHTAIEQIVTNLILNARDAMPVGGSITIKTRNMRPSNIKSIDRNKFKEKSYVLLSIADSGIGMDEEIQNKMYEPFFSTKESEQGTGLGLATVNEIVKEHQGFIECTSTIGEGTTFDIYFPSSSKSAENSIKYESNSNDSLRGTETLLVVEDDLDLLHNFKTTLGNFGYTVLIAKNGIEALKVFSENIDSINMVVADVILPEMGGMDIYLLFKKEHPNLPFLLISGYTEKIEPGINYLPKPFNSRELAGKIRSILDKKKIEEK